MNEYTFTDAVRILKDANNKYKKGNYTISVYSASVAKGIFETFDNPLGIDMCMDLINLGVTKIRSKAIEELVKEKIMVTPSQISKRMRTLKEVVDLGELFTNEVKASRISLDEMGRIYERLINGDTVYPEYDFSFSDN